MAVEVETSHIQITDASGDPVNGAKVYIYDVGTTSLKTVYSDKDLGVTADNPIICDSAGRHAIRYIATGSYKYHVKTSADVSLYDPRDNVDGRVPVGSGALAITNGGTGATTAGAALSNLGAATAAELADLAASVASLAGAAASSEKTHIATGTTAQRPASPAEGDIRRNTTTGRWEGFVVGWNNFFTDLEGAATQAEMETGTATDKYVSPGRVKFLPLVPKAWALFSQSGSHSLIASSGISGIADGGAGLSTLTLSTAMSSANYAVIGIISQSDLAGGFITCAAVNTTTFNVQCRNTSGTATDFTGVSVLVLGDV